MKPAIFHEPKKTKNRSGSVLLMVLGILALLSMIGTALVMMTSEERVSADRFMNQTRAELVAESGVDTAIAKLLSDKGDLHGFPARVAADPNHSGLPLDVTPRSSFGVLDLDGDGEKETAGYVSETFSAKGDRFRLGVESAQGKININDSNGALNEDSDPFEDQVKADRVYSDIPERLRHPDGKDPDWYYPGQIGYDENVGGGKPYAKTPGRLEVIIAELLGILFPHDAAQAPGQLNPTPEMNLAAARDLLLIRKRQHGDQFCAMHEVKGALVPKHMGASQFQIFSRYITLSAWRDQSTLKPTFQWRLNTPPVFDPGIAGIVPSPHMTQFPGRYDSSPDVSIIPRPVRPLGWDYPSEPRADLLRPVSYDFNYDGTIDPETEVVPHDHDIYMWSDMQTRYFELEARSPVDLNNAPLEIIEALLRPIRGWYLQEAPSTWDGEDLRSRAEDWSEPNHGQLSGGYIAESYPWLLTYRMGEVDVGPGWGGAGFDAYYFDICDESQYYYYDAYSKTFIFHEPELIPASGNTWLYGMATGYARKSARYGELKQSKSLTRIAEGGTDSIAHLLALKLYERIHPDADSNGVPDDFKPFQTWEEFEEFIVELADLEDVPHLTGNLRDFDIYMAHALIANFNPNSRVNDYNPNKRLFLHVDKSQLCGYSTEFCLLPMGHFNIVSLGEVWRPQALESSIQIRAEIQVHHVVKITSQNQFMQGYDALSGARNYFSESNGFAPTAGASFDAAAELNGYRGGSLQSYPEPEFAGQNLIQDSVYDGYLMLAVWKPERSSLFMDFGASADFYASYDASLNANYAPGGLEPQIDTASTTWIKDTWYYNKWELRGPNVDLAFPYWYNWPTSDPTAQVPANLPGTRRLTKPLSQLTHAHDPKDLPGNLHPDGALSDVMRGLRYASKNSLGDTAYQGKAGSLQFWIKPNFDVAQSNRVRRFFSAPPRDWENQIPYYNMGYEFWDGAYLHYTPEIFDPGGVYDRYKDFGLLYFSRGGSRVTPNPLTGRLEDDVNWGTYNPSTSLHEGRWLPTRAMMLHGGRFSSLYSGGNDLVGIGTKSVNQSWRESADTPSPGLRESNLESRQWSSMAFAWNWVGIPVALGTPGAVNGFLPPERFFQLVINGTPVEEDREKEPEYSPNPVPGWDNSVNPPVYRDYYGYFQTPTYKMRYSPQQTISGVSNYLAFGETSSALWNNQVADATFADCVSARPAHIEDVLGDEFKYGRYYNENDAVYSSPEFNPFAGLPENVSSLTLGCVAWTGYWPLIPDTTKAANHPRWNDIPDGNNSDLYLPLQGLPAPNHNYNPAGEGDPMVSKWASDWIPFSVDVMNPATGNWKYQSAGMNKTETPNFAGGSVDPAWENNPIRWQRKQNHRLRFKVHFNIEDALGQTLFSSPVFDDITFFFGMGQGSILVWENNFED